MKAVRRRRRAKPCPEPSTDALVQFRDIQAAVKFIADSGASVCINMKLVDGRLVPLGEPIFITKFHFESSPPESGSP